MKCKITISITVDRATLDCFSRDFVKKSLKSVIKERLAKLPPTYTIKTITVKEVGHG